MASQVGRDGEIQPPLNISAPTPIIHLRGFEFGTVDQKLAAKPLNKRIDPAPSLLAPQLPLAGSGIPQLQAQLELTTGKPPPAAPDAPITVFQGAWAGNGFNTIWRPRFGNDDDLFDVKPTSTIDPGDNVLELNLTTEQLTFGGTIGKIPNRGLTFAANKQPDIDLGGLPYLQTIQDVTNKDTGKPDSIVPTGIHFETGMWLTVPASVSNPATIVRMGSIPHGVTVNAQGMSPTDSQTIKGPPNFDNPALILDITPFNLGQPSAKQSGLFGEAMDDTKNFVRRLPQDLTKFKKEGTINSAIIKNPNLVLKKAIEGQDIRQTISFTISTGPTKNFILNPTPAPPSGGGTANISFLVGQQEPIAKATFMTATYWIETVVYKVSVPRLTTSDVVLLRPTMPSNSTAPKPVFAIKPPARLPSPAQDIRVPGIQIQVSQVVNLDFAPLAWPHVSVSTLVPTGPQPFTMPG